MGIIDFILSGRLFGSSGGDGSYDEGFADGKKSEYDAFWDAYQFNGGRTYYNSAFAREGWRDITFKPKYDIICTSGKSATSMFWSCCITDLSKIIEDSGIKLDTSKSTDISVMFGGSSYMTRIPEISAVNATGAEQLCSNCFVLVEFKKLTCSENTTFGNAFTECNSLSTIEFDGCIGKTINFQWSPLSVNSMKSIITHLKNYSSTSDAYNYSLTFNADCWSALEADSASPDGGTWREYVLDLGWNAV